MWNFLWNWLSTNSTQIQAIGSIAVAGTFVVYVFLWLSSRRQIDRMEEANRTLQEQLKSMQLQIDTLKEINVMENTLHLMKELQSQHVLSSVEVLANWSLRYNQFDWDYTTIDPAIPALAAYELAAILVKGNKVSKEFILDLFGNDVKRTFKAAQQVIIQKEKRHGIPSGTANNNFLWLASQLGCQ